MRPRLIIAVLLAAGFSAAEAAPNVPPSELPGRERYRFTPSPLDRFMQPGQPADRFDRWDCHVTPSSRAKPRTKQGRDC
jgi:hypothetical protein